MANDFRLKQNLKMSLNAQVKNLVPENLADVPPEEEWKAGRFWFNTTIGKLQGVFYKLDHQTGEPIVPEELEVRVVGADALGPTKDGQYWPDGLFDFTEQTKIADAMDDVNEALKDLSPAEATLLRGDLNIIDQNFISGRVARQTGAPDTLRMDGVVEGSELTYIVSNDTIAATLPTNGIFVKGKPQQQFGRADQGVISAVIDDVSVDGGINLYDVFHEDARDYFGTMQGYDPEIMQSTYDIEGNEIVVEANPNKMNYISSSGALTINTVERYNEFKKWQRGTGTVNFTVTPGRHTLHVEHDAIITGHHRVEEIPTEPFKTNTFEVFYDPNSVAPVSEIISFDLTSGTIKNVSGIPYYNTGIEFTLDFSATGTFTYTYWEQPISIVMDGSTHGLMSWNDSASSLSGTDVPMWDDVFGLTGYTLSYNSPNTITDNVSITAKAGKPTTGWGTDVTENIKKLIDTYPVSGNSTPLKETFIDEEYRINIDSINPDSIADVDVNTTGTWDSSLLLTTGNTQQFMGELVKAQSDFNEYGIVTDYTSLSGVDQMYYRRFFAPDKPNSNGTLKIKTNGLIDTDFDVFIKFPEISGWLDTKELFDVEVFMENYNVDGTGCAVQINKTTDGYEIPWTMGTFSTADSGYGYLIKVVLKTTNCKITEIEEISETWR